MNRHVVRGALLLGLYGAAVFAQHGLFKKKFEFLYVEDETIRFAYECLENPECATVNKIQSQAVLVRITQNLSEEIRYVTHKQWKRASERGKPFVDLKHPNFWPEDVRQDPRFFGLYNRTLACGYLEVSKTDAQCTKENCGNKIYKKILELDEDALASYANTLDGAGEFFDCSALGIEWFIHLYETNPEFRQQVERQILEQLFFRYPDFDPQTVPQGPLDPNGDLNDNS